MAATLTHMGLEQIASTAFRKPLARMMQRAAIAALVGLFALVALYHLTVAGSVALEVRYGAIYAHLIIAGVFAAAALIAVAILLAMRTRTPPPVERIALSERAARIAMIVEAVLLGYAATRKSRS